MKSKNREELANLGVGTDALKDIVQSKATDLLGLGAKVSP
ncbi:hypothetical protein J3A65_000907 [Rhizobium sp. PvP014]|nr:hypothetical protein [Rhizobium sp. PvP014]MBP2531516.1 hypothetical protein [Rhizobium sp. PvP099]